MKTITFCFGLLFCYLFCHVPSVEKGDTHSESVDLKSVRGREEGWT